MTEVRFNLAISLDDYVAGPDRTLEAPLAAFRGGHGLEGGEVDASTQIVEASLRDVGAVIVGRNMFGGYPGAWSDDRRGPAGGATTTLSLSGIRLDASVRASIHPCADRCLAPARSAGCCVSRNASEPRRAGQHNAALRQGVSAQRSLCTLQYTVTDALIDRSVSDERSGGGSPIHAHRKRIAASWC
jgi:hypothetical protein